MKNRIFILFAAAMVLSTGCHKDSIQSGGGDSAPKMVFGVQSVAEIQGTKAIVESIDDLQSECTPVSLSPFTLNESIGIWADYEYLDVTYKDLLSDVQLAYYDKAGGNSDGWNYNYGGDEVSWQLGGIYYFRAYYPQNAIKSAIISTSSAETFIVNYNSEVMQEDLLVGYEAIDTKTAPDLSKPVNMHLKHAMAALKFKVQFKYTENDGKYYDEDHLTSCWLRNTDTDGFTTAGMMVYGVTDDLGDYYPQRLDWAESYQPMLKFYPWTYSAGVRFANTDVNGDSDGEDVYDPENEQLAATAYTEDPDNDVEDKFAQNDGWLLVIPQKSDGTVEFCFTTKKGGSENIYSVKLPVVTGTGISGVDPAGNYWIAGYRYTYTISITKTDMEVYLKLHGWNQIDSSFSITF